LHGVSLFFFIQSPSIMPQPPLSRRKFVRLSGAALGAVSFLDPRFAFDFTSQPNPAMPLSEMAPFEPNMIGPYGPWAASLNESSLPALSFRRTENKKIDKWRKTTHPQVMARMGVPDLGATPEVKVLRQYTYDGLHVEELSWQLPYGRATEAILLKPENATGPLPGVLAFHDHGGNKYFGRRKITRTDDAQHPLMTAHQEHYYEGRAWANELARRGYVVLIADAFPFASRRVMMADVPPVIRGGLTDENPEEAQNIEAYNEWAGNHEHIMAKSLFCAGTTWPGVFFAEDRVSLDILCAREDVDESRIGCGGLSGGGMRTAFMGGLDPRIKCAVCVGFMSTWRDFLLHKSHTHTWMVYVPILPNELDFPEILGLRAPLPTLVLNDADDQLYTLPEMERADEILKAVYEKAQASDRYKASFYPGLHKFDVAMQAEAFEWWDRWLKV
jgi:dienelactone hydrolase